MAPEPLSPDDTTIVLIDYAVGFAPVLGSIDLAQHINNVLGLAKTALWYESGLVVTHGDPSHPAGPLYPELLEVLGDHPVIERVSQFNSFHEPSFARAVRDTGRPNLVVGGIATDGCVLQTVLGGLREGYTVHLVVDAAASNTLLAHETAVRRMIQAGVVPLTWYSLAAEFQLEPRFAGTSHRARLMADHVPAMIMGARAYRHGVERGKLATASAERSSTP